MPLDPETSETENRSAPETALRLLKQGALAVWVGAIAGAASALFLFLLDLANQTRGAHPALLFALPMAGVLIGFVYDRFAQGPASRGTNLLLEQVHDPDGEVPFRMAPLILLSTVATHLFGGSAGREGTAVQMGGTLAHAAVFRLRPNKEELRLILMMGMAAGFGSVFGTPFAGAVFALEAPAIGRARWVAAPACLLASFAGDLACRGLGIRHHAPYPVPSQFPLINLAYAVLLGAACGLASLVFVEATHGIQALAKRMPVWLAPAIGGLVIVGLTLAVGNQDYNGLGIPLIERAFRGETPNYAFLLKILFTAITLGFGFKGGEVTPLFCIGATLGAAIAGWLHVDIGLLAALGFVATFGAAANTPIACIVMGIELFGWPLAVPLALACGAAYLCSGHRGIYASQRIERPKPFQPDEHAGETLASLRDRR